MSTEDKPIPVEGIVNAPIVRQDTPANTMMSAITDAATNPNFDAEKVERLWAIAKEAKAIQAKEDFFAAMSACQAEMPKIIRDRENKQTQSWYSTLDNIVRQIAPVYTAHGFSLSFGSTPSDIENCIRIVCDCMHSGGHVKTYTYDQPIDDKGLAGAANKTQTHGRGSAVTYGRRYLTLMIFNLNTGFDDDGNGVEGPALDEKAKDWIAKCVAMQHPDEYMPLKREITIAYGSSRKIPSDVMKALTDAHKAVQPKDE